MKNVLLSILIVIIIVALFSVPITFLVMLAFNWLMKSFDSDFFLTFWQTYIIILIVGFLANILNPYKK